MKSQLKTLNFFYSQQQYDELHLFDALGEPHKDPLFKGQVYTECRSVDKGYPSQKDAVLLGSGTLSDVTVDWNNRPDLVLPQTRQYLDFIKMTAAVGERDLLSGKPVEAAMTAGAVNELTRQLDELFLSRLQQYIPDAARWNVDTYKDRITVAHPEGEPYPMQVFLDKTILLLEQFEPTTRMQVDDAGAYTMITNITFR
ncbi:hypothetical protein [Spirosoma sp.]|uniref:hypothetical protein n=1 Tax=Spirosoma sp. TaxID=1899569 RepID=UPI00261E6140|nr:hypothetical protein [Spirosoma sp.]MCX6217590.1 hypothetical protein [Spirosoma sp.]